MRVTAHFNSFEAGAVQFCEHFPSMKAAVEAFRGYVNDHMDADDASMSVYSHSPEDQDDMCFGDYPLALFVVGRRRNGRRTIKREVI